MSYDYDEQIPFGEGAKFEVGTFCSASAANTYNESAPGDDSCYDPLRLFYSHYVNCTVKGKVYCHYCVMMVHMYTIKCLHKQKGRKVESLWELLHV